MSVSIVCVDLTYWFQSVGAGERICILQFAILGGSKFAILGGPKLQIANYKIAHCENCKLKKHEKYEL